MGTNCARSYPFTLERLKVTHKLSKDEGTAEAKAFNLIFRHKIKR
jgi:hypothetical protein